MNATAYPELPATHPDTMNKIILHELRLLNFKGIHELTVPFDSRSTVIAGKNGAGKSTVFDAFCWLLFGKNAAGAKAFTLKTTNSHGEIIPRIPHEVSATLTKNGEEVRLRRCFTEKWQKKRGEAEEKFTGNTEERFWNDVPCSASEYDAKVRDLCPEEIFRYITQPGYFLTQPADTQRRMLFEMCGNVSDQEVARQRQDFADLLVQLSGKTLEEFKKEIAARKKIVKESLAALPGRIDERKRDLNALEPLDTKKTEEGIANLTEEVRKLDAQITDRSKAYEAAAAEREQRVKALSDLKMKALTLEQQVRREAKAAYFKLLTERQELQQRLSSARSSFQGTNIREQHDLQKLDKYRTERETLLTEYRQLTKAIQAADAPMSEADFCCPTCGRRFEPDEIETKRREITERYLADLQQRRTAKLAQGQHIKAAIEETEADLREAQQNEQEIAATIEQLEANPLLQSEPTEPTGDEEVGRNEELQALREEIAAEEQAVTAEVVPTDVADLKHRREELRQAEITLQERLTRSRLIDNSIKQSRTRISELEAQQRAQTDQLTAIEMTEFRMEEFSKAKSRMLEEKVNGMFQLVRYKLFDRQINGAEVEVCIPTVNGVPYADVNTAGKMNAGLDVIRLMSYHYGWTVPIFIDGAESIQNYLPTLSQTVKLTVSEDDELTVHTDTESHGDLFTPAT